VSPKTGTYLIVGHTDRCPNGLVRFTKAVGGASTDLGTVQADAQGDFSYLATFIDGETDAVLNIKIEAGLAPNDGVDLVYTADFTAPTVAFLAPLDGELLTTQTAEVQVQTTGLEEGASVSIASSPTQTVTATTDAAGRASATISLSLGQQTLTASVADAAGNPAEASISVTMDIDGCDVVVTSPTPAFVFNTVNSTVDSSVSPKTGTYEIVGHTTRCANGTVRFTKAVNGVSSELGTTQADDQGAFRYLATLVDGESGATLNVKVEAGLAPNDGVDITYSADFTPPTIAFVAPVQDELITAETTAVGLQTGGLEAGALVTIRSPAETVTANTDASGSASAILRLATGRQTLTAQVEDLAGNPATASVEILMDLEGCDVLVSDPAPGIVFNTANATVNDTANPKTGTYTVVGHTDRCPNGTVRLTKTVAGVATELGTVAADAQGDFSFPATFVDGEADATLNVRVEAGLAPNAGFDLGYTADFTPPSLVSALPELGTLTIVHPSNPNVGQPGFVADADPTSAGGQVDVALVVSGAGSISSTGTGNVAISGTTPAFSQTIDSNAQQTVSARVTFAEGFNGTATITLTDGAGNFVTGEWNVRVATAQLPTPTIALPSAGTVNVFRDLGGDRATYAVVQGNVTFSATPSGAQVYLCSNAPGLTGVGACNKPGFNEIAGTRQSPTGSNQFYSALRLPQGAQQLVAEMSDAVGAFTSSATVALTVDTVPPVVTSVVALEDTNSDGLLSGTELPPGQQAQIEVRVTGVPDGRQVTLYDGATVLPRVALAGGAATFLVTLSDGLHVLKASVTDLAGNPNESSSVSPPIVNEAATLQLHVDRTAPSISIPSPTFSVCNAAGDDMPSTPDCDLVLTASVGTGANRVTFGGPGNPTPAIIDAPFANNRATSRYQLGQGGPHTLTATVFDAAGNSREATRTFTVDTLPPTLRFLSPSEGETLGSQTFTVSLRATGAEAGRKVTVTSSVDGRTVGEGSVGTDELATFSVTVPDASQTLTASVSDLAGNPAVNALLNVQIDLVGCDINFTYPADANVTFNLNNAPNGEVVVTGISNRCPDTEVRFFAKVGTGPESLLGTRMTDGTGAFSFPHTFADGTVTEFIAELTSGPTNRGSFTARTDITAPTFTINSPVVAADRKLFVVAPTGNLNVRDGLVGYVPDADESLPGGQVDFDIAVSGGGAFDESTGGSLVIYRDGTPILSEGITTNGSVTLPVLTATLEQSFVGTVTVAVTDAAGNETVATFDTTVDVVPPEAPTVVMSDPGDGLFTRVLDLRRADIDVWIVAGGDDGPTAEASGWAFGYTTGTRLANAAFDDLAFDNTSITTNAPLAALTGAGQKANVELRGIPSLNILFVAPRALDSVGNRSPLEATEIDLMWPSERIEKQTTSPTPAYFGAYMASGDLNGDGVADLAVSAWSENNVTGSVSVYFGGPLPLSSTTMPGPAPNAYFGATLGIADIDGDHHPELFVRNGTLLDAYSFPVGPPAVPTKLFSFSPRGTLVRQLPDINGDGVAEVGVGNQLFNSSSGRFHVFYGRSDWSTVIQGGLVSLDSADLIITGLESGARLTGTASFAFLEDMDAPGEHGIVLGAYGANHAYLFATEDLRSLGKTADTTHARQRFEFAGANRFGFALAFAKVDGDELADLLIGAPYSSSVYLARQNTPGHFDQAHLHFSGTGGFGTSFAASDLNGDAYPDLAVGGNSYSSTPLSIFWATSTGLPEAPGSVVWGNPSFSQAIESADYNNDGLPDLAIGEFAYENGNVQLFY
ncbi:MAG TPA: hypothetical protein DFS52_12030, partial [Myxococcales bacterium]|nr:hypothetical protein [Myxococcales bacterium]